MKRWLKKWLPTSDSLQRDKSTGWIARWLHQHPSLWALNRKSVSRGVAAGVLVAFIPLPMQMLLASLLALLLRGNLPIALAATFISNPFTFVPINLLIYHTGAAITGSNGFTDTPPIHQLELHWESIALMWQEILVWFKSLGKSFVIGLVTVSLTASLLAFCLVHIIWRIYIWQHIKSRKQNGS